MTSLFDGGPPAYVPAGWRPQRKVLIASTLGPVLATGAALVATGLSSVSLAALLGSAVTATIAYLTPNPRPPTGSVGQVPSGRDEGT